MLRLSNPQNIFLNGLNTKFRAYVGGFGCVHPNTRVWTEFGLRRICDITSPVRVLSWSEKDQRFQLSLSGGSFPKGTANLIRVSTQQGEFESTAHHRIFSSSRSYSEVGELSSGDMVETKQTVSDLTPFGIDIALLPINGADWKRRKRNCIGNMNALDAATVSAECGVDMVIPMHYDLFASNSENPAILAEYMCRNFPCRKFHIMAPGERFVYMK